MNDTEQQINAVCNQIKTLLLLKNKAYGDSALEPVRIFSKNSSIDGLLVRIDDKLSRIKNMGVSSASEDTLMDLVGYAVLATMFSYSMFDLPLLHDWQPPHPAGYVTYKAPPTPAHHKPKVSTRKIEDLPYEPRVQIRAQDVVQYGDVVRIRGQEQADGSHVTYTVLWGTIERNT